MLRILCALVLCLAADPAEASRIPRQLGDDPQILEVDLTARPGRGIAPLPVRFEVAWYHPGSDRILRVDWDFEDDGVPDASGFAVTHVFEQPGVRSVVAHVVTRAHGTFTRRCTVHVHSAMMTLTFDDGHVTQLQFAFPLLRARGISPTAYVVPEWIQWREEGTSPQYLSWAELGRLRDAGWDIGSHTLTHPHLPTLPETEIRHELEASREALADHGFPAPHLALPHGEYDARVLALVPLYYESDRGTGNAVNPHPASADRWLLRSRGTNWFKPIGEYQQYIDEAIGTGGWLILNSHMILPYCASTPYCVESSMLGSILDYAEASGVGFATIDEVLSGAWTRDPTRFEPGMSVSGPARPLAGRPSAADLVVRGPGNGAAGGQVLLHGEAGDWTVTVHDVRGRCIARLHDGVLPAGEHAFRWDGCDGTGSAVGSGVYFVRAVGRSGGAVAAKTVILR